MICLTADNTELSQGVFRLGSDMHTVAHTQPHADINITFRPVWPLFVRGEDCDKNQIIKINSDWLSKNFLVVKLGHQIHHLNKVKINLQILRFSKKQPHYYLHMRGWTIPWMRPIHFLLHAAHCIKETKPNNFILPWYTWVL